MLHQKVCWSTHVKLLALLRIISSGTEQNDPDSHRPWLRATKVKLSTSPHTVSSAVGPGEGRGGTSSLLLGGGGATPSAAAPDK